MRDYNFGDALNAVLAPSSDPTFWLGLGGFVVAMTLLVLITPRLKVDERRLAVIEACRRDGHRCNRKPNAPLRRSWYQRFPGLYSEQVCRCQTRQRIRWLGGPNSARAIAFKNSQAQ